MKRNQIKLFITWLFFLLLIGCTYQEDIIGKWRTISFYDNQGWGYEYPSHVLAIWEFDGYNYHQRMIILDTANFSPIDTVFYETGTYAFSGSNILINGTPTWIVDEINATEMYLKDGPITSYFKKYP
jgi:hypothetical protein